MEKEVKKVIVEKKEKKSNISLPTLETFLKAGAHFGHKKSTWNPKMEEYIYEEREGIHIIDLIKTMKCLKEALEEIEEVGETGNILLVGTKGQAATVIEKVAEETGAFYINNRWPGGLFTNFEIIRKGLERLIKLEETLASGSTGSTKKEQLMMKREVERLNRIYCGIKLMERLPKLVVVVDSKLEKIAIKESRLVGVPVVALLDTNCDPTLVNYPIPANDDSIKSISLFVELLGESIKKGKKSQILLAMRKNYYSQLESKKKDYERELEREAAMLEEEKLRVKRLKVGGRDDIVNVEKKVEKFRKVEGPKKEEKEIKKEKKEVQEEKVSDLKLDSKIKKLLEEGGITTVSELKSKKDKDILALKGIGAKALESIKKLI